MNILQELNNICETLGLPVESGVFSGKTPSEYIVITPLNDTFTEFADDVPHTDIQAARLSIYTKDSYVRIKNALVRPLFGANILITDRRYVEYEEDTQYHHYEIDTEKNYLF